MTRLPDWTERHIAFVASRMHTPFSWGSNDCGLFFADHTLAITGIDIAKHVRGYTTERAAMSRVRKCGGMREVFDLTEKHRGFAQRGDGVLADMDGRETFGVVLGDGCWCGPGAHGLIKRPMSEALLVYEI